MKQALRIASVRAVRTFAQTAAGGLLGLGALSALSEGAVKAYGMGIALVLIGAAMSCAVAFFQNLAEALPE